MLAQQLRESSSLFDSLDAMRHWRALLLLAVSFLAALALWGLGGWLWGHTGWRALLFVCAGVACLLLLWAGNSAGILMMDDVAGQPRRTVGQAARAALGATQQLVLVLLALALFYLLGLLALTVVLLVCSVPVAGPWLYAVVFPVATVASGVALFVLPALVFPLCAPALWLGLDASTSLAQLWAVVRQRLSLVLTWMLVLGCITALVWMVLLAVLLMGASMTGGVSAAVLGAQNLWSMSGVFSPGRGAPAIAGLFSYAQAAATGSTALFSAACAVPSLVAMRGACIVYRRALLGLSTVHEEKALSQTLMSARGRMRDARVPAPAAPQAAGPASSSSSFSSPNPTNRAHEEEPPESLTTRPAVAAMAAPAAAAASTASSWLQAEFSAAAPKAAAAAAPAWPAEVPQQQQQPRPPLFQVPAAPSSPAVELDLDLELPLGATGAATASATGDSAARSLPCPLCGGSTESTDFFCGHCGHALR